MSLKTSTDFESYSTNDSDDVLLLRFLFPVPPSLIFCRGVWNGIWGLFLSCPFGIRGGGSIRASVLNFSFFAIPTVFCAITVVFNCLHGFSQRSASHQFFRFEAELRNQDPNSMPTIDQINQAAKVFQDGAYAYHRMAQGYTYFFCFAVLLTILLAAVGF